MVKTNRRNVCYESRARRAYWSTHIEAWLRSGVTRERYCREHRLNTETLKRWLAALQTPLPKPRKRVKKAGPKTNPRLPARGSTAFIAFWLMHIEAQCDSGLSVPWICTRSSAPRAHAAAGQAAVHTHAAGTGLA